VNTTTEGLAAVSVYGEQHGENDGGLFLFSENQIQKCAIENFHCRVHNRAEGNRLR
jgi:hypothetical protein